MSCLAGIAGTLFGRFLLFGPCVGSLLAGVARLAQLIVKVSELIAKACDLVMKVGRLSSSVRGGLSSPSRLVRRAPSAGLGFGA